jgi:type II secretory pathway pseudopilin PulG
MQNIIGTVLTIVITLVLIIGAIAVYESAQSSNAGSQATQQLAQTVSGINALYQGQQSFGDISTSVLVSAKVFPEAMVAASGTVTDPWGGSVTVAPTNGDASFLLTFAGVPTAQCIKLAQFSAGAVQDVKVNGTSVINADGKVLPSNAASACTAKGSGPGKGNSVAWQAN